MDARGGGIEMNTPEELFALGRYCENLIGADVTLGIFYSKTKNKHTLTIFNNKQEIIKRIPFEEIVKEYGVEEL